EAIGIRDPYLNASGMPDWYHPGGDSMMVAKFDPRSQRLVIGNGIATVTIEPSFRDWKVIWKIEHPEKRRGVPSPAGVVHGYTIFSADDLIDAFMRRSNSCQAAITDRSRFLLARFGGNIAHLGKFIVW